MSGTIRIHEDDNVAVALKPHGDTPAGHKVALRDIAEGGRIIKYANPIGVSTRPISEGEWVHTHNMRTLLDEDTEYSYTPVRAELPSYDPRTFQGYLRADGRAGIRNEIWIIPTVGCINSVALRAAEEFRRIMPAWVDDTFALTHPYGCSQLGDDQENMLNLLAALAKHPNAGGALILGLGCENCGVQLLERYVGDVDRNRVKFMSAQDEGDELEHALELLGDIASAMEGDKREPLDASLLTIGLKCGGSDGFSGITANPLLGAFSDMVVSLGGKSILTEVPEMFGAERLLMNRCADEDIYRRTVRMIEDFKDYYKANGQPVYENPSPGNKAGGISTLEDKSLGCTQKGGRAQVVDVLAYAQTAVKPGLSLLNGPGNDIVACTALAASGAQLVLFTTGRGTPLGAPVPTVKVASNTALFERKRSWCDFNAGGLIEGASMDDMLERFSSYIFAVASGERTRNERAGCRDMAIFKTGVIL